MPVSVGAAALLVAALGVLLAARAGLVLTPRLALVPVLALPAAAVVDGDLLLVAVLVAVGALVALDVLSAGSPRSVAVRRDDVASTRLGEPTTAALVLTETAGRPLRGAVRDLWGPSAGAVDAEQPVRLPARGVRRVAVPLRPTRRGTRRSAGVAVRRLGPLRLAGRQAVLDVAGSVRVLPAFPSRRHLPEKLARLRLVEGDTVVNQRSPGNEFDSLREYVPGDDVRSVDWRATARSTTTVVRVWRPERDRRVVVVLDTGRTGAARVGLGEGGPDLPLPAPRLEASVDAALLLAALAGAAGDRVDVLAGDVAVRARVAGGRRTSTGLLSRSLADLQPRLVETDLTLLVGEALRLANRRSLVVLLGDLAPAATSRGLLPVLGQLTRRHAVVVAGVADPRLAELAAGRGDGAAVHGAAAAQAELAARARVAGQIARLGAVVVDAPPGRIAPDVADAYLDLKAQGRL